MENKNKLKNYKSNIGFMEDKVVGAFKDKVICRIIL